MEMWFMNKKQLTVMWTGVSFWGIILYLLFCHWEIVVDVFLAVYTLVFSLYYVVGTVFFIIVLPSYCLIKLVKERNTLRKKVQELEALCQNGTG